MEDKKIPTKYFETIEIETWIGESLTTEGKEIHELDGGRSKLIVLHQCGENREELLSQLETLIDGIKNDFDYFAH
jgi:heterodisulfide reductase subunit A-like polyferredoxin